MSFRAWVSLVTLTALLLILFIARHEVAIAWKLLGSVNLWILWLIIPVQFISFYGVGNIIFEYLRAKHELKNTGRLELARMALELNFVNHVLPSGGVSGFSYLGWRLSKLGVSPGRATMAQAVRFALTFLVFVLLLMLSVILITLDGSVNRFAILTSSLLSSTILFASLFGIYIIGSLQRLHTFAATLTALGNALSRRLLRGRELIRRQMLDKFFTDLHKDYIELKADTGLLKKPFFWALLVNLMEVAGFMLVFLSLGVWVNPAMLLIAYGLAGLAGFFVATPGGLGAYEALMISFLVTAGAPQGATIAAVLLARVILILLTIITGYVFYQLTVLQYGKQPAKR